MIVNNRYSTPPLRLIKFDPPLSSFTSIYLHTTSCSRCNKSTSCDLAASSLSSLNHLFASSRNAFFRSLTDEANLSNSSVIACLVSGVTSRASCSPSARRGCCRTTSPSSGRNEFEIDFPIPLTGCENSPNIPAAGWIARLADPRANPLANPTAPYHPGKMDEAYQSA